jgi:hypothetical protein
LINVLIEGDYHCGHELGLTPPGYGSDAARVLSGALWNWREEELKQLPTIDIHVLNGDATDGPGKKETIGLFITDVKKQADMAAICADRVKADHRYITYGTPFHTVSTLSHEELVADKLKCEIFETLRLKLHGRRLNVRHVCGRSDTPYGQGTQVAKEIVREQLQALLEEYQDADILARGHVHYFFQVVTARATAFTCPALELPNPDTDGNVFARKLRTQYYNVGR